MVKSRRYGDHGSEAAGSANASLLCALSVLNRLFAPYLPFVTEEVWSWWQPGSVHSARWPTIDEIERVAARDEDARLALDVSIDVLREIRRIKSTSKKPAKTRIRVARIHVERRELQWLQGLDVDLRSAAAADRLEFFEKPAPLVVELEFDETTQGGDARE
jgi:valyl-tRNA synthetase